MIKKRRWIRLAALAAALGGLAYLMVVVRPFAVDFSSLAHWHGTDKGPKAHNFSEVYEYFFSPIRTQVKKVLEIGIANGGSMKTFRD